MASIALVAVAALALSQRTESARSTVFLTPDEADRPGSAVVTFSWTAPAAVPLGAALVLPVGATAARLSSIPDALLNDPPAARYRVPVEVRGRAGLATVDGPLVLAWSEDGYWYELSSSRLDLQQLVHLASALE